MKTCFVTVLIFVFCSCTKDHNKIRKPANRNLISAVPYTGNEKLIFQSGSTASINVTVSKKVEEYHFSACASGCTDTIGDSFTFHLIAEGDPNPYLAEINFNSIHDDAIFLTIFPTFKVNTTGNSAYFLINPSTGEFICDGFPTICLGAITLNNTLFNEVISVDTRALNPSPNLEVLKFYYSKQYGIVGYTLNDGQTYSLKL